MSLIEAIRKEVVKEQAQKEASLSAAYADNWGEGGTHTDGGDWTDGAGS